MGRKRAKIEIIPNDTIAAHFNRALQEKVVRDRAKYMRVFKDVLLKNLSEDGHDFAYHLVMDQLKEERTSLMRELYVDCLYNIAAQSVVRPDLRKDAVVNMIKATERTVESNHKDKMYDFCSNAVSCIGSEAGALAPNDWTDITATIIKGIDAKDTSKTKRYKLLHALRGSMERNNKENTFVELAPTQEVEELLDRKIAEIGGNISDVANRRTKGYYEDINILADLSHVARLFMYECVA